MTNTTTLYGIPNCDTVKKARAWFEERGMAVTFHDFKKQGVPPDALRQWARQVGWQALLNTRGTTWRKLDEEQRTRVVDEATALELMLAHSSVIKRPVVVRGDQVTVGYVPQHWEV
jgi:arsenate reductase (glutaredoxin)